MVCSIGSGRMAVMARLLAAGTFSQTMAEEVGRQKFAAQDICRELRDADEANLLDEEDMHVFGLKPMAEPLHLVCCNACKKPIKASQYAAHAGLCRSLNSAEENILELDGSTGSRKPPRKERKKLLTAYANQITPVGEREKSQPVDADDAIASESQLDNQIGVASFALDAKQYMPGGSLYDYLHKNHNVLELPQLLEFAIDVSKGMEYLHQRNIIHRDLKTANLLMDNHNAVKVADFGVARFQNKGGVMTAETGTYRWMAPEVINHQPYNQKADVFSFAIVLWELVTAKVPYDTMTPLQAALGVRQGLRPDIPQNAHPKLLELMQRCWEAVPENRPSFSEITAELENLVEDVQVQTPTHNHLEITSEVTNRS